MPEIGTFGLMKPGRSLFALGPLRSRRPLRPSGALSAHSDELGRNFERRRPPVPIEAGRGFR